MRFHTAILFSLLFTSGAACAASCDYTVEEVVYKHLVAKAYLPRQAGPAPLVLAFGGSEGGLSTGASSGEMLAPHCIAVLALAYFKEAGLPPTLDRIPLDYFIDAVDYAARMPGVDKTRLGVLSGSRGSEAALLLASMDARIKSVAVAVPSAVPWHGRTGPHSAWTFRGSDIPAVSLDDDAALPQAQRFDKALDRLGPDDPLRIKVERINGPLLLISALDDAIWPSTRMANDIVERLRRLRFTHPVRHDAYPTGHGFSQETAPAIKRSVIRHFEETL